MTKTGHPLTNILSRGDAEKIDQKGEKGSFYKIGSNFYGNNCLLRSA